MQGAQIGAGGLSSPSPLTLTTAARGLYYRHSEQRSVCVRCTVQNETKSDAVSTTWFSMFAELDPLSNPDAFGRSKEFSVQA